MAKNTIDIRAGRLFPLQFLVLGGVLLLAGALVIVNHPIIATILILPGLLILTAYEGTEINPYSRTYREYNSFLFQKIGKYKKYSSLEGVFLHKAKVTQRMFTPRTLSSSTFTHIEYHVYLKTGNDKIFLMGGRNKGALLERARGIAGFLNTSLADHAVFP